MNWPSSNSFKAVRQWIDSKLAASFDEREAGSIGRILMEEVSQQTRAMLLMNDYKFSESELNKLNDSIAELILGKPLQQVLGNAYFLDFNFFVTKDTLAPRPETEELVLYASKEIPANATVLDIGTGTGCIAISLKALRPDLTVQACDVSLEALAIAASNAKRNGVEVEFFESDILTDELKMTYHAIVSNPPYIPISEAAHMDERVVKYEPGLALFVEDAHPLKFYKRILDLASKSLTQEGQLFFECHKDFAKEVHEESLIYFKAARLVKDMQGNNRMVMASNLRYDK
ncbi:MAG: release factor glutamine methyltransferase [Flavobacteriales bacterium]